LLPLKHKTLYIISNQAGEHERQVSHQIVELYNAVIKAKVGHKH